MRTCLEDVLATMLAVCLSTEQQGNQLFLQVIGDAGSGKTSFCDALVVSKTCYPLEHLTGFFSGYKEDKEGDKDFSLAARMDRKTLITPEGDVLMSNPKAKEIMAQQRRIFDGTSGATYKNLSKDRRYVGMRTPWIIAGTPALLEFDQSHLGDRFLRVCIDKPDEEEMERIADSVCFSAMRSVRKTSNCQAASQLDEPMARAYQLTGGYVDYLRGNAERLLMEVDSDERFVANYCRNLGYFTSDLRAKPNLDPKRDVEATKEMPTRLMHQYIRMAFCLAVVLNKKKIDLEVLEKVKKIALDSSLGTSLKMVRLLHKAGRAGMASRGLEISLQEPAVKISTYLTFLRNIGVAELTSATNYSGYANHPLWRLTPRMENLYQDVLGSKPRSRPD